MVCSGDLALYLFIENDLPFDTSTKFIYVKETESNRKGLKYVIKTLSFFKIIFRNMGGTFKAVAGATF
jgi:hypothetical protein